MSEHDFVICHKPGNEMPADFLSRNVASISSVLDNDLQLLQSQDDFISDLIKLVKFNTVVITCLIAMSFYYLLF